jgi:hypothetical protein
MTLENWQYGDPANVAERKEEHKLRKTCAGCVHMLVLHLMGRDLNRCAKGGPANQRCKFYKA